MRKTGYNAPESNSATTAGTSRFDATAPLQRATGQAFCESQPISDDPGQTDPAFTASRLAQAIGISETAVRNRLAEIPPSDTVAVKGNAAAAWRVAVLPAPIRARLQLETQERGLESVAALASDAKQPWQPKIPLSAIAPKLLTKAGKLRRALANTIGRLKTHGISKEELARLGLPEFSHEFGYAITPRRWIQILDRTVQRDNGGAQWNRLEIYLDDRIHAASDRSAPRPGQFDALAEFLSTCEDPANLSDDETALLWQLIFEQYDACPAPARKRLKRRIVEFICASVPVWNHNAGAFDKKLRRDFPRWKQTGEKPLTPAYTGRPRGLQLSQAAYDAVVAYAVLNCGGRVSQAWRDYMEGEIQNIRPDPDLLTYYALDPGNKSWVPRKIRALLRHEVRSMEKIHHGPRQYEASAHLPLDHSSMFAGDWWSSDDLTADLYFYKPEDDWFKIMRGQVLLTVDEKSRRILSYVLIPEENYNSIAIRNHVTACADTHGLPRRGFIWENGQWADSRLLKGQKDADFVPANIAELGLLELGLKFKHRKRPTGKTVVESVIGAIQKLMQGDPGYCGADEMHAPFEALKKLKLAIERRATSPAGKLYSFDQWFERIGELCARYNRSRQDGRLAGLSPDEAYEQFQDMSNPPIKFDASTRYLLSTHRRAVRVTDNGITIQIGKRKFLYRNRRTGELKGRTVLAWFNPEDVSVLYVTDVERRNPFAVERVQPLDPVDASPEDLAAEMHRMREHQAPVRARYNSLKAQFQPVFRQNIVSPQTVETGARFTEGAEEIHAARDTRQRGLRKIETAAADAGVRINHPVRNPDRVMRGIELEQDARARILAKERREQST
jgi:hypothetical protein